MTLRRIALTVIGAVAMGGIAFAEEPLELVNPGFEATEGEAVGVPSPDWEQRGAPPGWSVWYGETARASNAVMAWTAAAAHTGGRSVSVRSAAGPVVIMQQVPVEPGAVYALRAWARVSNPASTARVGCRWKAADGSWANSAGVGNDLPDTVAAGEWAQVETIAQVPEDAAFLVIMLTGQGQGPEDACWFDDVTVARLTGEDLYVGPASSWLRPMLEPVDEPLVTPHIPWANPRAGGPLSVLFLLGNDHNIREAAELAQRLEMDYDVAFGHEFSGLLYALNDQEIRRKYAEGAYDVIVAATRTGGNLAEPLRR